MSSMLDLVREAVTPDLMRKISAVIGESPGATEKAMGAAVPTILESLADKASTVEGAERLRSMISEGGYGAGMLDKLGATLSGGASESLLRKGSSLISGLFGHRAATIADTIASVAGISRGSSSSLLGLAAPLVMSVLGKQVASRSLDAAGLMGMLTGQRSAITSALPAGLGSLFGAPSAAATAGRDRERVATASAARESPRPLTEEPTYEAPRRSGTGWLLPGLAIAALALLGTLFLSQRRAPDVAERVEPPRPAPAAVAQPTPVTQAPTPPPAPEPSPTPAASPREAAPAPPGFLAQLGQYLEGGAAKPRRFVFENLTFAAGSAELTESSREMVDGVASLLKGHPSARIVVEGFTDNSGSAAANTELSQRRAEAVKEALVQGGVDADRIEAQGHGPERPIASNTIADGRARNRRTELVVSAR